MFVNLNYIYSMKYLKLPFKLLGIIFSSTVSWLFMTGLFFMITTIETAKSLFEEIFNTIEKE